MRTQVFSKMCKRCEKKYLTYEEDKEFCTDICKFKKIYCEQMKVKDAKLTKATKQCRHCGERTKHVFCDTQCQYAYHRMQSKQKTLEKSFKIKEKPKRKGASFAKLGIQAEWKRVNDDESWLRRFDGVRI